MTLLLLLAVPFAGLAPVPGLVAPWPGSVFAQDDGHVNTQENGVLTPGGGEMRPQALFNRGNYMMEEEDFARAVEIFGQIEADGHASGALFYNMGISYLYLDSLGQASYYFHKSTAYRESAKPGKEGIETVERLMRARGTLIPQLPWYAFVDWFLFDMPHLGWVAWSLVLLNAGVLVLLVGWRYRPNRRVALAGKAAAVAGVLLLSIGISVSVWAGGYLQAVITTGQVVIQPQPDYIVEEDMAPDLAYEAYTVTLDQRQSRQHDGWVHIRLRNGVSGWIPESAVRIL
ncbi:MAG: hypothetical protein ACQETM_00610 [Bacteroidota bacterium]